MTIDQLFDICSDAKIVDILPVYKDRITEIRKIFSEEVHHTDSGIIDHVRYAFEKVLGFPVLSVSVSNDHQTIYGLNSIVVATDSSQPLDLLSGISPGCKVYDLGRPHSFDVSYLKKQSVELYEAGLVSLPDPATTFGSFNMCGLPAGTSLGCLAETMVLAASGDELRPTSYRGTFLHSLQIFERSRDLGMTPVSFPMGKEIVSPGKDIKICKNDSLILNG